MGVNDERIKLVCTTYGCIGERTIGAPYCAKCEEDYAEARAERIDREDAEQEYRDYNPWVG